MEISLKLSYKTLKVTKCVRITSGSVSPWATNGWMLEQNKKKIFLLDLFLHFPPSIHVLSASGVEYNASWMICLVFLVVWYNTAKETTQFFHKIIHRWETTDPAHSAALLACLGLSYICQKSFVTFATLLFVTVSSVNWKCTQVQHGTALEQLADSKVVPPCTG